MTISPQMTKINQLRAILQPTEVEKEKFPRWFRLRRGDLLPRFFDHWGRTMARGGYVLVAEPYYTAMTEERWEEVRRFAIKYDLNTWSCPIRTISQVRRSESCCGIQTGLGTPCRWQRLQRNRMGEWGGG